MTKANVEITITKNGVIITGALCGSDSEIIDSETFVSTTSYDAGSLVNQHFIMPLFDEISKIREQERQVPAADLKIAS